MRIVLILAICGVLGAADDVRTIERHAYPTTITTPAGAMRLVGVGDADWGLFNIHTAALYLPAGADRARPLVAGPVRLVIRYQRDFTAADFVKATNTTFGAGLAPAVKEAFAAKLAQWNALYGDRARGQEWRLTWTPGTGIELSDETLVRGVVPGDDFARELLGIWLGDHPVDGGLRTALIGR
jgi:hypothetical protein